MVSNQSQKSQVNNSYRVLPEPPHGSYEWVLCNYFEGWKPETVKEAISQGYEWDFGGMMGNVVNQVVDQFLDWAKTYRPDLYEILKGYEGRKWFKTAVIKAMKTMS